jgi:hypothetical protein
MKRFGVPVAPPPGGAGTTLDFVAGTHMSLLGTLIWHPVSSVRPFRLAV